MAISTIGQNGLTVPLTSNTITSASATALTLQSGGTTAVTINTSQQVGVNTTVPSARLAANTPSRNDGLTNTLGAIVAAGPISDSPSYLFSASTAIFRVQGTDASNNLQFGIGSSGYNYNPWIQGSYDNGSPGSPNNGAKDIVMQPLGGSLVVGTTSSFGSGPFQVKGGNLCMTINSGTFNYSFGTASNQFNVYDGGGTLKGYLTNAGTWTNTSDIAFKKDIVDIRYNLNDLLKLRPVSYVTKDYDIPQIGFIAQEMEQVIPEVVSGEEGSKGISYGNITPLLVKAIQELKAELDELKAKVNA